jgi:hypothetical protein
MAALLQRSGAPSLHYGTFGFRFRFFQQGCSGEVALATLGHFVQLILHPTILTYCFFLFFACLPELVILEVAIYGIHQSVNLV